METKRCGKCGETKPISGFYRNAARHDGLGGYCAPCQRACDDEVERRKRSELLALLGGKCTACGFSNPLALQVDHVNGGGTSERRTISAATRVLLRRVRESPAEYQLLCANCNIIKRMTLGEHVGIRSYERVILTARVKPDPGRKPMRHRAADERVGSLLTAAEARREAEASATRLPPGSWSRVYRRCICCLRDDRCHSANGFCNACYRAVNAYRRRQTAS